MDQFFNSMRGQYALSVLDFAGASQANVSFITEMGHRLSSEDYIRSLELAFGGDSFYEKQADEELVQRFLEENLNFQEGQFDGALVWDSLQFLSPPLLQITVDRLYHILRPNSSLLAFFSSDEKTKQVPLYRYQISDAKTLMLTPRGHKERAQYFNNRGLERLFQRFQSVKFFLTRDNLREIIVRR
ncbi:MAG TPA: class I SAM-dependent methyltransferase [Bryobacteraceae bacterium]|nr:class I SAM-dependent methyltransferase [Bryobacteraceae bacterium]